MQRRNLRPHEGSDFLHVPYVMEGLIIGVLVPRFLEPFLTCSTLGLPHCLLQNVYTLVCIVSTSFWVRRHLVLERSQMIAPVDGAELTDSTTAWWGHAYTVCSPSHAQTLVFKLPSLEEALVGGWWWIVGRSPWCSDLRCSADSSECKRL